MLGMNVPIHPERGQIIVTERLQPLLDLPVGMTRQTNEGSLQLGNSHEDVGFDNGTTLDVTQRIAARAVRAFPQLARSEEHTSELQSLMRISYAVFCLKKKKH